MFKFTLRQYAIKLLLRPRCLCGCIVCDEGDAGRSAAAVVLSNVDVDRRSICRSKKNQGVRSSGHVCAVVIKRGLSYFDVWLANERAYLSKDTLKE